ncbi:4Fe-4S dicluster domain-containing protein [Bacillus sp. B15-48]|uniref:4Fe-4S dicluster domain-containing protein n=1 Tax=Bacillus sp. B15-48 TaxID=1548601 RepID=UPI00193F3275|nr:4Fe-4S dicluster domain-containing protein [Bacillus sp. B15-48]MBM4764517.1 4Fe-4S dicluster domain-containing protein [Bacillus sp. B15-48]
MSNKEFSRRDFIKYGSSTLAALGIGTLVGGWFDLGDGVVAFAASEGYIVVDTKKCAGCMTCMMACSLAHEGRSNPSLSRIQITQDNFAHYPNDIAMNMCRQCPSAPCVEVCPTLANHPDPKNANVRLIDEEKCIGCQKCIEACPYTPSRIIWNFEDRHAQKCDLCVNTPYWNEEGGPSGKQACVSSCPMQAIKFTSEIPIQNGSSGYDVNLRTKEWGRLGIVSE